MNYTCLWRAIWHYLPVSYQCTSIWQIHFKEIPKETNGQAKIWVH